MSLNKYIKENLVLVIGLALPVLLIALFFLATVLPKSSATPPQYPLLFSVVRYDYSHPLPYTVEFFVKDKMLKARVSKNGGNNPNGYAKILMVYDGKTDSVREIAYDVGKFAESAGTAEITLEETKSMVIDNASVAPDGYQFDGPHYNHGGLLGELFGGYRNQFYRVKKGAVVYKIPNIQDIYYNNVQSLGWVVGSTG